MRTPSLPPPSDDSAMDAEALVVHLQAAAEIEKTQLARKLHDELAGLMVSALMDLSFAGRQPGFHAAGLPQLERAKAALKTAIDVSRRMVEDLRPSMLDNFGLFAALQWELKKASQDSAAVCTQAYPETDTELDAESSTVLFRVAQEALALIFSRGALSTADLRVGTDDGMMSMRFTYDGTPLQGDGHERGTQAALASMRHRIKVLGGNVELTSKPAGGCVLTAWMPLERRREPTDT
jgi:two-component system sensor histidine kinase UhpB